MTAAAPPGEPGLPPSHLLTVAEYAQLGETSWGYTELRKAAFWRRRARVCTVTGTFTTTTPCPLQLQLDQLR